MHLSFFDKNVFFMSCLPVNKMYFFTLHIFLYKFIITIFLQFLYVNWPAKINISNSETDTLALTDKHLSFTVLFTLLDLSPIYMQPNW